MVHRGRAAFSTGPEIGCRVVGGGTREALPPGFLAAGYSMMYAAAGAGYAATGSLAGGLLQVVAPSTAILAGVVVTLLLTALGWWGEARRDGSSAAGDLAVEAAPGAEGAPVAGRCDAERGL